MGRRHDQPAVKEKSTTAFVGGPVVNGTGCNLTTGWQVNASFEHYWTPQFHESFYGGIEEVRYNSQANALLCTGEGAGTILAGAVIRSGSLALAAPGCNNNFDIWTVGTRFQYDFTKTLYIGVDFLYSHLDTAQLPGNALTPANTTALLPPQNGATPVAVPLPQAKSALSQIRDVYAQASARDPTPLIAGMAGFGEAVADRVRAVICRIDLVRDTHDLGATPGLVESDIADDVRHLLSTVALADRSELIPERPSGK
jgi:hypothetical protein